MSRSISRIVLVFALGLSGGLGVYAGNEIQQRSKGGGYAGTVKEPTFIYSHNEGGRLMVETARQLIKIPDDYGEPFAVTTVNNQQVVWYRSPEMGVRNIVLLSDRDLVHLLPRANLAPRSETAEGTR